MQEEIDGMGGFNDAGLVDTIQELFILRRLNTLGGVIELGHGRRILDGESIISLFRRTSYLKLRRLQY